MYYLVKKNVNVKRKCFLNSAIRSVRDMLNVYTDSWTNTAISKQWIHCKVLLKKHSENTEHEEKRYVFYAEPHHLKTTAVNGVAYFFFFSPVHMLFCSAVVWTTLC